MRKKQSKTYWTAQVWEPSLDKKPTRTFIEEENITGYEVKSILTDVPGSIEIRYWDGTVLIFHNMPFVLQLKYRTP